MFPTEKPHVSYSEVRTWKECPYRHKLTYIDKIESDDPSQYLDYGVILHEHLENFLKKEVYTEGTNQFYGQLLKKLLLLMLR